VLIGETITLNATKNSIMNELELQLTNMEYLLSNDRGKITGELKVKFIKNIKKLEPKSVFDSARKLLILKKLEEL
jgi:hypothetical protein